MFISVVSVAGGPSEVLCVMWQQDPGQEGGMCSLSRLQALAF